MRVINPAPRASVLLIAAVFAAGVAAQTVVYPAKGQSADQQKKDEGEATPGLDSKYDPPTPPHQPPRSRPPRPPAPRRARAHAAPRAAR
jgi:hypothetical protein